MKTSSIETLHTLFLKYPIISKDSRKIDKDCLYFALKGNKFDGNKFAKSAIEQGAAYAIVDNPDLASKKNMFYVPNVLTALQELANFHRNTFNLQLIAITGSNGKTTTKELVATVLKEKFNVLVTEGNFNNHIGVPLTLLQLNASHEIAVIEMGANHQGEIDQLCNIANPTFGLITNVGKSHLEGFGGIEGVKKGKSELYKYLNKQNHSIFINKDDNILTELAGQLNQISYGTGNAECIGKLEEIEPFVKGTWTYRNIKGSFLSNLYGKYNFYNILAAICIGNYFEVEPTKINSAIGGYSSKINRSQLIEKNGNKILLDAYNANPSSMKLAIENLKNTVADVKIAILGDMFELGDYSKVEHKSIVESLLDSTEIDKSILVGENFYKQRLDSDNILFFKSTNEAKEWFTLQELNTNTAILIKGSRGMAMERILD